jgi:acetate---CoA ligase (ADP-forming)
MSANGSGTGDRTARMRQMLEPRSAAIVGVSEDPIKYGTRMARSAVEAGFDGDLYFVNPKPGEYMGHSFVPSLSSIGSPVDVVMVSVPSTLCPSVVEEAGELGCGSAVVVANGFAEIGQAELQDELVAAAARADIPLVGPNCMGLFTAPARFNAMGDASIPAGRIAVVAQSGNVGIAIYHAAKTRGLGLSYFISLGNQADVAFEDVLLYLADDEHTDVVLLYVEGFHDTCRFLDAAGRLAEQRPVAVLRGGRSAAGARSAASHTGSMAGDDAITAAALRRAGLVEVDSPNDLLLAAMAFGSRARMRGRSVSVVADSGGYATLGADAASHAGLSVDVHPERVQARLREFLLPRASFTNPVDMIGGVDIQEDIIEATVGACLEDPDVDAVALVGAFAGYEDFGGEELGRRERAAAHQLVELRDRTGKPLVVQTIYEATGRAQLVTLRAGGVPVVEHLDEAMRILSMQAAAEERAALPPREWSPSSATPAGPSRTLREDRSREWLEARLGRELPPWQAVEDEDAAVAAASALPGPAVLKVLADSASHKTEVGGVILNVRTEDEVREAWRRIAAICEDAGESPRALVTEYATGSAEAMIGVFRHPELGPLVLVGTGGVFAESLLDRALLFPPFGTDEVLAAVGELQLGRVLESPRASEAMAAGLAELAVAIGDLAAAEESLVELDLNPVLLSSRGATALDVRVVVA